ncbi:hypothetical protein BsWGS_23751 [Bradybaena similaris]
MSCENCEISAYMMNHRVSEQSPMRPNYLTYSKTRRSKSGQRIPKSPSDIETRHFEDRGHARKRQSPKINKLLPRKSESDLCLEDIKKQRKRGLLATTLLGCNHEAWDSGHSLGACGTPAKSNDKLLEQKEIASFKKNQDHGGSSVDKWNNHKTNCSLTRPVGAAPETHKNSTHFERLFADKNTVHEFAALNAALPSRKLFFMQEYPCKLMNSEAKQAPAEMAGCSNRRSYIEKSRKLFGFSHKLPMRDKFIFPETCGGRNEIPVRPVERPHAAAAENDHEIYASYIGDHCRKNRRGRNSNKSFNLLPQSNVDMDYELGLHGVRGDNLKRSLASFDSHTFSDLSSEYPFSDLDERPFENCNFSHVPSQKELNFNAFLNDKKKLKKVGGTKERSARIAKKHDKRGRCRSRGDIDDGWDSSVSVSDRSSLPPKRRTKKKRQRSGTKKTSHCKQNMPEEENKNSVKKHYNEQRRHSSKDVDKKAVSRSDDNVDEIEYNHRSESKTRRKFALLDELAAFIKNDDHFKPMWTCTKWSQENINKTTQDSTASHWAYEVYSDTCLNPGKNGLQIGISNQRSNDEDLQECDLQPQDHLRETNQGSLGCRQPLLCSANVTNLPSDKPYTLAECTLTYNGAPNVRIIPFLAANYCPMIADQAEGESRQLTRTMWSQVSGSENCHSNIDTVDRAINTSCSGRHDHRMAAENNSNKAAEDNSNKAAEDKYNSQETITAIDSCNLRKYKKEVYIKNSKHETCLNQTNYTKERHKLLETPQSSSCVKEGIEVPASDIPPMKSQSSVDEKLIRTVHSIKVDIESVFDRLNSLDAIKDDSIFKTALSLKDSVRNVLLQAKSTEHNSTAKHVINAAEIIKSALKTLTTFKATSAVSKTVNHDPHELSYELYKKGQQKYNAGDSSERDFQIVSIDSTRQPYVRVEKRIDCKNVKPSSEDSLSDTAGTSCSTLRPKHASNDRTANALCASTSEKRDRRKQYSSRLSNRTIIESNKSALESTILKKLSHSREKSPLFPAEKSTFSSAESTFSRKSREAGFEQKFEEMLARFPPDEREIQVTGIPESLARERKRLPPVGKTKKKRKASPYGKIRKASISKKPLYQDDSAADETPPWRNTKRSLGRISVEKILNENENMTATPEMLAQCQTGVMMQPQIGIKGEPSGDTSMEPVASCLAPCEVTDIAETMEAAPGLKKYREQMLQPACELDEGLVPGSDTGTVLLEEPLKSWRDTSDFPKTTRDIHIIYKISSKTTLTEDDKSFINAICLRKTEEEIMSVPYDSESTSPTIGQKGFSDPCSTDTSKDVGSTSSNQLWGDRSNTKDTVEESGAEIKGPRLPSEEFKSASANNLFGHKQQRQVEMSKELLSSEINQLSSSECLEKDVTNVDSGFSKEYHLTKQTKTKKSSQQQEMPNSLCNITELTENVVSALDSNKEPSLESFDMLVSACKEIQGAQHNKALEMQAAESYDTSISSGYVQTRETTELFLPDSGTSMNRQRQECIQIQQNEIREKPTGKATWNEASEVLDNATVSMLNASIIKLYEEVSKLRIKLEATEQNPKARSLSEADKRKSRSHETSKKKKSSKDSSSKSTKSSCSTQSSRASSRGYKAASDDDERSPKKEQYFAMSPVYSAMRRAAGQLAQTELRTSPSSATRQYCCSFRKYDSSCPETILEYYDKKLKGMEQVPHEIADNFYLEYEPECISPALYIEHKSQNPSPASYMEMEDDDSSVASYAKQAVGTQEDSDTKQNFQYFEKNMSRCVACGNTQEKADAVTDNYWSEFRSVSPNKPEIIEATSDQYRERDDSGAVGSGKFDHGDVTDSLFLREQPNSGVVQEYLSREKQSIVEYTSNTLIPEGMGLQLNEIAAKMDSVSAQPDRYLLNSNEPSDLKDDFGKCNLQPLEPDKQIHSTVNYDSGLQTEHCHTNEDSETATEKTQHYSNDHENTCDANLTAKEEHNTDLSNTLETIVSDDKEQRSNLPPSASEQNARVDVNSKLNSNPPTLPSAVNYSKENLSNVSKENLNQSSSEDKSEHTGEPVKTPTPPMWSDSEESLGKNEEDYIASLHIPRIVQCVRDMFFGSTKAQSKEANRQSPKSYDWQSGTSTSSKVMSSSNSEMANSQSRCPAASDTDDDIISGFSSTWRGQSLNENIKDDDSDAVISPPQHNYIFRKKNSRLNTESQASPSMESLKKTSFEVDERNEESPNYSDYSWTGKDIGNYNFVGSNIFLTSNPFIQCRSMGYLPAFKHVEETDKTIRHYCDAINSNTSKRLPSLDSRYASVPKSAGSEGSSSAQIFNTCSEDADEREVMMEYGRTPVLENCSVSAQNDWSPSQCPDCFPKWQSQMTPSPMLASYREDDALQYCETTTPPRRPCYVEHCGFRQKKCDHFENGLCGRESSVNIEANRVSDNNSSHEVTRKEDVQGRNDYVKHSEKLRRSTDMFYANEGMMDNVPFECSKKLDSSVSKSLFTLRDVSETKLYSSCNNIRSVDYARSGQMKHYRQEPRRDQAADATQDVEKSKTVYEEDVEKRGKEVAENDGERVNVSDDENTDIDAASDDGSMEDDERESWYKTTDDESSS